MESLEIIYGILIGLSTAAILRVIDSRSEIKENLTSLMKQKKDQKLKPEVDLSEFNHNTRMTLNDNNEYVFRY